MIVGDGGRVSSWEDTFQLKFANQVIKQSMGIYPADDVERLLGQDILHAGHFIIDLDAMDI